MAAVGLQPTHIVTTNSYRFIANVVGCTIIKQKEKKQTHLCCEPVVQMTRRTVFREYGCSTHHKCLGWQNMRQHVLALRPHSVRCDVVQLFPPIHSKHAANSVAAALFPEELNLHAVWISLFLNFAHLHDARIKQLCPCLSSIKGLRDTGRRHIELCGAPTVAGNSNNHRMRTATPSIGRRRQSLGLMQRM